MKKTFLILFIMGIIISTGVFAQTAYNAYSAIIREAQSYANSCGPGNWPQFVTDGITWLGGRGAREACNDHDIAYGTLGISKASADNDFYNALKLQSWTSVPVIASTFNSFVRNGGHSAYNAAQNQSKEEFRKIHHGNQWTSSYEKWHPSYGHIRMSFPQCVSSCPNLSRR